MEIDEKTDSVRISRTAKGTATWEIKIYSKNLTLSGEQENIQKALEEMWNNLKKRFPS